MKSNVYFFQHATLPLIKIGKANDWKSRFYQVGGGSVICLKRSMYKEVPDEQAAWDLEYLLHRVFKEKRVNTPLYLSGGTEWFCETIREQLTAMVRGLNKCQGISAYRHKTWPRGELRTPRAPFPCDLADELSAFYASLTGSL